VSFYQAMKTLSLKKRMNKLADKEGEQELETIVAQPLVASK
jgi:hypothetical protein